jgi:hypothetical protein
LAEGRKKNEIEDDFMKYRYMQFVAIAAAVLTAFAFGGLAPGQNLEADSPRIAWYSTLEGGLAEAKRSNRPILFTSAAPQCLGVSGIW